MAMLIIINGYTHWILEQTQVACADVGQARGHMAAGLHAKLIHEKTWSKTPVFMYAHDIIQYDMI